MRGDDDIRGAIGSDDLGKAGEAFFELLCARAGLTANRSDRDRMGWDFTVESPVESGPLDKRLKTICHVQVKTTAKLGNVPLTLSSAGLLAMAPSPAMVVIFRTTADGAPLRGYLIHLLGQPLAKLLHRLRRAEALGRHDTNKLSITFDYKKFGMPFDPTPEALRAALLQACGPDPVVYTEEKSRQLENLGYDEGGVFADVGVRIESAEHLTRVLFGLEPLRPERIEAVDVRFGISVPYTGDMFDAVEEFTLSPPTAGFCQISVTGGAMLPAATFRAELLFAPSFDSNLRMLIKHPDFTLMFCEKEASFESTGTFSIAARPLADLVIFLRALSYLSTGKGEIVISDEGGRFPPIRLPARAGLTGPDIGDVPALAQISADWQQLLELAGVKSMALLSIDDLWGTRAVQLASDLLLRSGGGVRLEFDSASLAADGSPIFAVLFNSAGIAGESVSYAVEVVLGQCVDDPEKYESKSFRPIEVIQAVSDLDEYMEDLVARTGSKYMIHPDNIIHENPRKLPSSEIGQS
ncbi:hypothetical protein [Sphingomonas lycopersici]|uniref:DUF4365 domain-containing protein n=1 Tax=Sphingomonas lycopersici TaxID=2951807 RepID=A0AA41ZBI4_9SPHN|nr:hypothetical protein [Sphingomonas lycopersici]MCW6536262.1 hypothetical protein [Sphingomonas lycopersici]